MTGFFVKYFRMKAFLVLFLILTTPVPVSALETEGFTPLTQAVANETAEEYLISTLLRHGADINALDDQGRDALMLAAMHNPHPAVIAALINGGMDPNARKRDTGETALFFAVKFTKNPDIVRALLNNGADQDIRDVFGRTAYDYFDRNPALRGTEVEMLFKGCRRPPEPDNG